MSFRLRSSSLKERRRTPRVGRPLYFLKDDRTAPPAKSKRRQQNVRMRSRYLLSRVGRLLGHLWIVFLVGAIVGGSGYLIWKGLSFWRTSQWLQIQSVDIVGEVSPSLKSRLLQLKGQNILKIKTSEIEAQFVAYYPELSSIEIERTLHRHVVVQTTYRTPLLIVKSQNRIQGLDGEGRVFVLPNQVAQKISVPELVGRLDEFSSAELTRFMSVLSQLKTESPTYAALIKQIKTDRMPTVTMELQSGIRVIFLDFFSSEIIVQSQRVLEILNRFKPVVIPAEIRVVSSDRLIMDSHWKAGPKK